MKKIWAIGVGLLLTVAAQATEVTGVVRNGEGQLLEGVEIQVLPSSHEIVTSGADGTYKLTWRAEEWWDDDTVFYMIARDPSRELAVALPIGRETESLDLTLQPAVTLTGQVIDAKGRGVSGAKLRVMFRASNWGSNLFRSEDSFVEENQGTFEIKGLPADGHYGLTAMAKGYGQTDLDVSNLQEARDGRLDIGKMTLIVADKKVSGRVVDLQGQPVAGIHFHCYGDGQPDCQAHTDEDGMFCFDALCEGAVTLNGSGRIGDQRLSCRATAMAGATDIELVAVAGRRLAHRFLRSKSYDDILATGKFVAGRAVDEAVTPVANVPVNVSAIRREREPGKYSWTYTNYDTLGDVTDDQGRFIIEVEEDAAYCLCVSPLDQAAVMIYDLPMGTRDYQVTLPEGGTVIGRVMRVEKGQKVPMPEVEVKIEQTDRACYSHLGFDQDRTVKTDSEGRFRFEHLRRFYRSDRYEEEYSTRIWEVTGQGLSQTVGFYGDEKQVDIELLVKPKLEEAQPLQSQPLPDWETLGLIDLTETTQDQALLLCFYHYEQRLDRRWVARLARQQEALQAAGVTLLAIDVSNADTDSMQTWFEKLNLNTLHQVTGDLDEIRFLWNIQSLPWLIRTDADHQVTGEGVNLAETLDSL